MSEQEQQIQEPEVVENPLEADQQPDVIETTADTPEGDAPAPAREWSDEDAEEAKAFGWKPPEEWRGELPPGYIDDPRKFMERAENFRPFKKLKEKMTDLERSYEERFEKLNKTAAQVVERTRRQAAQKIQDIRAEKRAAAEMGDVEKYDTLEQQERAAFQELRDVGEPQQQEQQPPAEPQEIMDYRQKPEGAWLNDPFLRNIGADAIDAAGMNNAPPAKQIEVAEQTVKRLYPHLFELQPQQKQQAQQRQKVDGGGLAGAAKPGLFDKLPSEAKTQFQTFVKQGIFKDTAADRKMYAEEYNNG